MTALKDTMWSDVIDIASYDGAAYSSRTYTIRGLDPSSLEWGDGYYTFGTGKRFYLRVCARDYNNSMVYKITFETHRKDIV